MGPLPTRLTIKDWLEKKDEKTDGQKDDKGLRINPRPIWSNKGKGGGECNRDLLNYLSIDQLI